VTTNVEKHLASIYAALDRLDGRLAALDIQVQQLEQQITAAAEQLVKGQTIQAETITILRSIFVTLVQTGFSFRGNLWEKIGQLLNTNN
jgi:hypothetical protein